MLKSETLGRANSRTDCSKISLRYARDNSGCNRQLRLLCAAFGYSATHVILLAFFVIAFVAGCDSQIPRQAVLDWSEPVVLKSGENIRVRRHVQLVHEASSKGTQSAPLFQSSTVSLEKKEAEFPTWDAPLIPILLEKDPANDEWVIVASNDECGFWLRNGKPQPPYWAFRLRGGRWYRDVLPNFVLGEEANLFVEADTIEDSASLNAHIDVRKAQQRQQAHHPKRYSAVDAGAVFEHCGPGESNSDAMDLEKFGVLR
jgi:hypothetical protein